MTIHLPFLRGLRQLVVVAVALAIAPLAGAQAVMEVNVTRLGIPDETPDAARSPDQPQRLAPASPARESLRAIWNTLATGDWHMAETQVLSLRTRYPAWRPDDKLLAAISRGQRDSGLRDAFATRTWTQVLALAPEAPACEDDYAIWLRSEALTALEQQKPLLAFHTYLFATCSTPAQRSTNVERAARQLNLDGLDRLLATATAPNHSPPAPAELATLRDARHEAQLKQAIAGKAWSDAAILAFDSGRHDLALTAGWAILESDAALARALFHEAAKLGPDQEARLGEALAGLRLNDPAPGLALLALDSNVTRPDDIQTRQISVAADALVLAAAQARAHKDWNAAEAFAARLRDLGVGYSSDADRIVGETLLDRATGAFEARRFRDALGWAQQASAYAGVARPARMREAWTRLELGEARSAELAFRDLYVQSADAESAEGLVLAAAREDRLDELTTLASAGQGPLAPALVNGQADAAIARKDFATAQRLAPSRHQRLAGVGAPWVEQTTTARLPRNSAGDGRFEAQAVRVSTGFAYGGFLLEAGVTGLALDSTLGGRTEHALPYFAAGTEGAMRLSVQIAEAPGRAIGGAPLVAEASIERRATWWSVAARAFATPKDDSATSLAGRRDPAGGAGWGAVIETGLEARSSIALAPGVRVTGGVLASRLTGLNVANNDRVRIDIGGAQTLDAPGFDYIATGPFYQFDSYARNTNFETRGHGGYFSPQEFHRAGWSLNLQTAEMQDWMLRLDGSLAYEMTRQSSAPVLPLQNPLGAQFASSASSSVAGAVRAEAAYRVSANWTVGGWAAANASTAYSDVQLGLSLRFTPEGRRSVVSGDFAGHGRGIW